MSDGYKVKDVLLNGASQTVGASATDQVVTKVFPISSQDSLYFRAVLTTDDLTDTTGITAKLQHSWDNQTWLDVGNRAQVTIDDEDNFEISLVATDASDAAQLPLWSIGRIVVSSGADDAVTVTAVKVSSRV